MFCLDTNIVIDFLNGNKSVIEKVYIKKKENKIFITFISLCELYKGIYLSNKSDIELKILDEFLNSIELVEMNKQSCDLFGKDFSILRKKGKMVPEADLMIASIVKTNNLILITMDKKHFNNLGIKVEVW